MSEIRKFILFSYTDKNGDVQDVQAHYGQKWSELKTDNDTINSIFAAVDNGDGVIEASELNFLNNIVIYIDNLKKKTKDNETLETEELKKFEKVLKNNKLDLNQLRNPKPKTQNWSEGLDRNITEINVALDDCGDFVAPAYNDLVKIGNEQGFWVNRMLSGGTPWTEDPIIRRHDGKIYVPYHTKDVNVNPNYKGDWNYKSERGYDNSTGQGRTIQRGEAFGFNVPLKDRYYGESYLEGGNVLNTRLADGTPAAVVGESSIGATLGVLGLENTPENVKIVKEKIARDLGLELDKVTFIPQHRFHIDMIYRPLHNGEFAVPDYDEGVKLLLEVCKKYDEECDMIMQNPTSSALEKENAIKKVEETKRQIDFEKLMAEKTKELREEASDYLCAVGYKLVKIPCLFDGFTNFMNGVGGTSKKTGQTFYITNKSEYPEMEELVEPYLKKAGIDKVYFVSTVGALMNSGGVDCLTQEM